MKFFEYTSEIKKEWDEFILNSPYGSVHQISDWKNFQETIPGREQVLGFFVRGDSGKILATTFCVKMETGFFSKHWYYSARGPVFDPGKNLEAGILLIENITENLKKTGGIFWRIDPYFTNEDWQKIQRLTTNDQQLKIFPAVQNYQPTDTLEIDLTQSESEILEQMKRRGRQGINRAKNHGIKIEILENGNFSEKDLDDFYNLNLETTSRDKFSGHQKTYYENFLKLLKNHAVLFFATFQGKRIATAISTFCGNKAIYYFGASTSDLELNTLKAPTLLQWEMMRYGKQKNCKTYDFLGIAPEDEPNHPYAGISQFKHGFGGYRKIYEAGKEISLNPFWHQIYRMVKKLKK